MPKWSDYHPHKALLYPFVGYDDNGQPKVSATPIELDVRWEQTNREVTGPQGAPVKLDVIVQADREIAIGSIMWRGGLADLIGASLPPTTSLMQVISYDPAPGLKGEEEDRDVGLMRWNDTALPT